MAKSIASLVKRMTLKEKISLLAGTDFWHTRGIERLGIPSIKVTDGPHGARTADENNPNVTLPATCFPTGVGLAATWNPELVRRVGAAIGDEARARGCSVLLGPCVNIHRSPLGGRNFESYSEDPFLSAKMAVAIISGIQSRQVSACVKHFALNNQEYQRLTISSEAGARAMREIYFPSFEKAVKEAGTWSVMCSYNRLNGTFASANRWMLTEVLKEEWGFKGLVMSDWFAAHSVVPAAKAGLDLEMPGPARYFGDDLLQAVKSGKVDIKIIDDKVRRLLGLLQNTSALDSNNPPPAKIKDFPAHRRLAREAAEESIVLLKNDRNLLPLDLKTIKSIAVIGPNAAEARVEGGGSAAVTPYYTVSPLAALRSRLGKKIKITYELGCPNNVATHILDTDYLLSGENGRPGLTGEYFPNNNLAGKPMATRLDTSFKLTCMEGTTPVPQIKKAEFSIRWQGIFKAPATGKYKFGLTTNGWGRIFINDKPVCNNWSDRTAEFEDFKVPETVGEIALQAGKKYRIRIGYCRNTNSRSLMRSLRLGCDIPLPPDLQERAARAASMAGAAIVFTGLTEEYESEGFDRKDMALPPGQDKLIKKVAAANPNTIVVLNNGSPVDMAGWIDDVPAVVEALYPGQECGNGIAAVLCGDVNPSGKLPDTYPRRLGDNPTFINYPGESGRVLYGEGIFVGYRYYDAKKIEPLFPFGHGLSYTSFRYRNLKVSPLKVKAGEKVSVSIDVKNTGQVTGKEVVQVYVADIASRVPRPPKELKAFRKISLEPGETRTVDFTLDKEALAFYDPGIKDWAVEPGEFEIQVGSSSRDIRARQSLVLSS
ncbi:MAG: glycoside hydrolase family 3 C-terminal domain-containing protein [Dehalococcoidales bacterium]